MTTAKVVGTSGQVAPKVTGAACSGGWQRKR